MLSFNTCELEVQHSILQYLLELSRQKRKPAIKCASFFILIDLFSANSSNESITYSLQMGLLDILQEILDSASQLNHTDAMALLELKCAAKIVWQISNLKHSEVKEIISSSFLKHLLGLLHRNGPLYSFSSEFLEKLKNGCKNKYLVGQCSQVKMNAKVVSELKKHRFYEQYCEIPNNIYECRLFDTSGEIDINVSEHFIGLNLAWPVNNNTPSNPDSKTEIWNDIFVADIVTGNIFWAQVGEAAITTSKNISDILCSIRSTLSECRCEQGDLVGVVTSKNGCSHCYRARVLDSRLDQVKVFVIDFGFTELVDKKDVFALPVVVGLLEFPMQASLCCLTGVEPPPVDLILITTIAAALCNFVRYNFRAASTLVSLGAPDNLLPLLQSPEVTIGFQITRILCNLSHYSGLQKQSQFSITIKAVLKVCSQLVQEDNLTKPLNCFLIEACIACLTNLLKNSRQYREEFQANQGLNIVMKILARSLRYSQMYRVCVRLLRNFLSSAGEHLMLEPVLHVSSSSTTNSESEDETESHLSDKASSEQPSNKAPVLHLSLSDEEEEEDISRIQENTPKVCKGVSDRADPLSSGISTIIAVNSATALPVPVTYYEYGSRVPFSDDATHELRPNSCVSEVSSHIIISIVCSMLNCGRKCTIYFGIGKDQKVFGMHLSRTDRDEFRLGVDRIMNKLFPPVLHFQFDLEYVPVFKTTDEQGSQKLVPVENTYVAEIRLNSSMSTLYTVVPTEHCFYRFGHTTSRLSCQEVRQLAACAVEEIYKDKILQLRKELSSL